MGKVGKGKATGRPSMFDVARLAGVSHQTVSRVINSSPDVAATTREKVLKAIEELGYRIGFQHVASGPLVRSSYHADEMAHAAGYVQVA